jgi:hypothetical protein
VFRRAVGTHAAHSRETRRRRHIHDAAATPYEHRGEFDLHGDKDAAKVHADRLVEVFDGQLGERRRAVPRTGVVEGGVEPTIGVDRRVDHERYPVRQKPFPYWDARA